MDYKLITEQIKFLQACDIPGRVLFEIFDADNDDIAAKHAWNMIDGLMKNACDCIAAEFETVKCVDDNYAGVWDMVSILFETYHALVNCYCGEIELLIEYINNKTASVINV